MTDPFYSPTVTFVLPICSKILFVTQNVDLGIFSLVKKRPQIDISQCEVVNHPYFECGLPNEK